MVKWGLLRKYNGLPSKNKTANTLFQWGLLRECNGLLSKNTIVSMRVALLAISACYLCLLSFPFLFFQEASILLNLCSHAKPFKGSSKAVANPPFKLWLLIWTWKGLMGKYIARFKSGLKEAYMRLDLVRSVHFVKPWGPC